jgi:hypothetical protein
VKLKYEVAEYVINVDTCSLILVIFLYKESNLFCFCTAWQVYVLPHELIVNPLIVVQMCMFLSIEIKSVLKFHYIKILEVSNVGKAISTAICCHVYGLSISSKSKSCVPE